MKNLDDISKEDILNAIKISKNKTDILKNLNLNYRNATNFRKLNKFIQENNISLDHFINFKFSESINYVSECSSIKELALKLKLFNGDSVLSSKYYRKIRDYLIKNNIDFSHFNKKYDRNTFVRYSDEEIFIINSKASNNTVKERYLKVVEYKCNCCGISNWKGQKLSLHLDHIDGNNQNNQKENLQLLCPNCHSQTLTYCGRNSYNT